MYFLFPFLLTDLARMMWNTLDWVKGNSGFTAAANQDPIGPEISTGKSVW